MVFLKSMATYVFTIPIDKAGRIVLPKEIRDRLGLSANTKLVVEETEDKILLKAAPEEKRGLINKKGWLVLDLPADSPPVDIVDLIKQEREKRSKKIAGIL